jgi:hypothetical protein
MSNPADYISKLLGKPGDPVPTVDPSDLKTHWQKMRDLQAKSPGVTFGVAAGAPMHLDQGSDTAAVWFRATMIAILTNNTAAPMAPWISEDRVAEPVFRVMAKIPMHWIGQTVHSGLPFDMDEFFRQLQADATSL